MISKIVRQVIGSRNDRVLKEYRKTVQKINTFEPTLQNLSDEQLQQKTLYFKQEIKQGKTLEQILPEAFAVVREAGKRVLGMRHFDTQMLGGIALHQGKIAEMRTGEGKTLVATLPVYLNALLEKGVHVITVNDYLAQRDAKWMSQLYGFLGLSTGVNLSQMSNAQKRQAYACDITYGTNNEFGFDYLRDNLVDELEQKVQRIQFAIVDEVDSILIDEARTPLIISAPAEDSTPLYHAMNLVPPLLIKQEKEDSETGDFYVDEKAGQVHLSELGHEKVESIFLKMGLIQEGESLYDSKNMSLMHHLTCALRAHNLFFIDQQYVVQDDSIIIVDEFTGRLMPGRRWSEGLHQAIEAKEGVSIQQENKTAASITFQNYFRLYPKLSGMTGTADTEAYEFQEIYRLETIVIPPHRGIARKDFSDKIYRSNEEKYAAIVEAIKECYHNNQPVLVGTTSIENSELISNELIKAKLPHNVLNAKQHEREADIIAEAGKPGKITIATNMAGRGTDIILGGNKERLIQAVEERFKQQEISEAERILEVKGIEEQWKKDNKKVIDAGGLHIIGTERHESRRIDNQLRGRSGRQGDVGSSRFYLSMDDQLLRIFAGERMKSLMDRLQMPQGEAIESKMVSRSIESAQRKVEGHNFDIRKQLLEYDDVANEQRKVIYHQRDEVLTTVDMKEIIFPVLKSYLTDLIQTFIPENSLEEEWNLEGLFHSLKDWQVVEAPQAFQMWLSSKKQVDSNDILDFLLGLYETVLQSRVNEVGEDVFFGFSRAAFLRSIDTHWQDHLTNLDQLRQGIHLRGYAQKNPKQEYKREAFELFSQLLDQVKEQVLLWLFVVQLKAEDEHMSPHDTGVDLGHIDLDVIENLEHVLIDGSGRSENKETGERINRNDPCPCNSGKKYKHCHGKIQ